MSYTAALDGAAIRQIGSLLVTRKEDPVSTKMFPFRLSTDEPAPVASDVTKARIAGARANPQWKEIESDLVLRGRLYVSAGSDYVYSLVRGAIFEPGSSSIVADRSPYFFTVEGDRLTFFERQPEKWAKHVERQAERERRRNAPRKIRLTR